MYTYIYIYTHIMYNNVRFTSSTSYWARRRPAAVGKALQLVVDPPCFSSSCASTGGLLQALRPWSSKGGFKISPGTDEWCRSSNRTNFDNSEIARPVLGLGIGVVPCAF